MKREEGEYTKRKEEERRKTRGRCEERFQPRHERRLGELVNVLLVGGRNDE